MAEIALLIAFPILMGLAASFDLTTMKIPNRLNLTVAGVFFIAALAAGFSLTQVGWHLAAGAAVLAMTFAMFAAGWIGGGDAKLAAATALWFGLDNVVDYLAVAGLLGGVLTLALLKYRATPMPSFAARFAWAVHLHDQKTGVPYGIALAFAALLVMPQSDVFRQAFAG